MSENDPEKDVIVHPELYSKFTVINPAISFVLCWKRDEGYYIEDFTGTLRISIDDEEKAEKLFDVSNRLDEIDLERERKSFSYKFDRFLYKLQVRIEWARSFFTRRASSR